MPGPLVDFLRRQRPVTSNHPPLRLSASPERDATLEQRSLFRRLKLLDYRVQAGLPLIRIVSLNRHIDQRSGVCKPAMYLIEQGSPDRWGRRGIAQLLQCRDALRDDLRVPLDIGGRESGGAEAVPDLLG